jgi:hypothetical protein
MLVMPAKFTYFNSPQVSLDTEVPYEHGWRYMLEEYPNYSRLKIGASTKAIDLLLKLSSCLEPPYYCLYVLVVGRSTSPGGRYQSPLLSNRESLIDFLLDYKDLFESDGRHHLWVSSPEEGATLVYDKHNVIYAYGPLEEYIKVLLTAGYREEAFDFPYPHGHNYLSENDGKVEELLQYWDWQHSPLQEIDDE